MTTGTGDRTWPLPNRPWSVAMCWHDLLFLHVPVSAEELRPLIPRDLEVETFEGQAWLGFVPFAMTGVRPRHVPNLPWMSCFPEFNVRTYVTAGGKPGVWFFSLDASNPVAVWFARRRFHLPYHDARIRVGEKDGWIHYACDRQGGRDRPIRFRGAYRPLGPPYRTQPGALDHWLTARYCLYAADSKGCVFRGEIDHVPWQLQKAEAKIEENTMAEPLFLRLPEAVPLLHFSKRIDAVAWSLDALDGNRG